METKKKLTASIVTLCVLAAAGAVIFYACGGGVDAGDDYPNITSIGRLQVQFYKDLDTLAANGEPLQDVDAETAKVKDQDGNETNTDDVQVTFDDPENVIGADGVTLVRIADIPAEYDWRTNPDGYSGFSIVVKFLMPGLAINSHDEPNPDYGDPHIDPNSQLSPTVKVYQTIPDPKEVGENTYQFIYWKTLTGVIPPDTDAVLDVQTNKSLARALVKTSGEDVTPAEYVLRLYALYEDSLPPTEALKLAAQRMKIAEEQLARLSVKKFDDEYVIGKSADGAGLIGELNAARDALNVAMKGTEKNITADLGNGKTETITVIEYDVAKLTQLTNEVTNLTQAVVAAGITAQSISSTYVLAYTDTYGEEVDPLNPSTITTPGHPKGAYSMTIATDGVYEIELYGASGGHTWAKKDTTYTGGKGAYAAAQVSLKKGNVIRFYLGSEGGGTATFVEPNAFEKITSGPTLGGGTASGDDYYQNYTKPGGWNGGGSGGGSRGGNYASGAAGGGAADVRVVPSTFLQPLAEYDSVEDASSPTYFRGEKESTIGLNGDSSPDPTITAGGTKDDWRIIVAGGGGGSAQRHNDPWPALKGGVGGQVAVDGYKNMKSAHYDAVNTPVRGADPTWDNGGNGLYCSGDGAAQVDYYYYTLPPPGGLTPAVSSVYDITGTDWWKGKDGRNATGHSQGKWEGSGGGGGGWVGGATMIQNAGGTSSGGGGSSYWYAGTDNGRSQKIEGVDDNLLTPINYEATINNVFGSARAIITRLDD